MTSRLAVASPPASSIALPWIGAMYDALPSHSSLASSGAASSAAGSSETGSSGAASVSAEASGTGAASPSWSDEALELLELFELLQLLRLLGRCLLRGEHRIACRYTQRNANKPARNTPKDTPTAMPMLMFVFCTGSGENRRATRPAAASACDFSAREASPCA